MGEKSLYLKLISTLFQPSPPFPLPLSHLHPSPCFLCNSIVLSFIFPFPRNPQAQPLRRRQKPASLSASATLLQRLVLHAFLTGLLALLNTHTCRHPHMHAVVQCISPHCYLRLKKAHWLFMTATVQFDVDYSWMWSTLTQTYLSIPQYGSCSSFGTFRPAFSHTGTIRPLSVIVPASPTFTHSPGSNNPSPTSKVPSWKVCFCLQI